MNKINNPYFMLTYKIMNPFWCFHLSPDFLTLPPLELRLLVTLREEEDLLS
jgi:hypothetical protein